MAASCADCGRGNADTATACLYCGAAMSPSREAPPGRLTNPIHLIWVPGDGEDAGRIASLLDVDSYHAGMIERSGVPRALRTFGDAEAAASMRDRARALGLRTFLVDEHALDTHPPARRITAVRRHGEGIVLFSDDSEVSIDPESVELMVSARVSVRRRRVSRRISMLPSEAGATPGIPRVVKRDHQVADHPGVLDLYPTGRDLCLRAREESIDFSRFGGGPPSALLHFARLVSEARRLAPGVAFDDRFTRLDAQDPAHAGRTEVRPGVTVLDGVARFARYSRLLWRARREFGWRPD